MYKIDSLENAVRELYYSGIAGADYERGGGGHAGQHRLLRPAASGPAQG